MYNPKHNDRSFDLSHADNIHADMTPLNRYWDWKYGLRSHNEQQAAGKDYSFEATEREFYESQYSGFVAGQTQRNVKAGHAKRNRGIDEILADKRFCPEETLYQIGKDGDCPDPEILIAITTEFMEWMEQSFGSNVKILDWALHLHETSPHIHARQTFFYTNKYGETEPKQEKALECLGIPIKYPEKKPSKTNNRKVKFDEICRDKLLEICQQHGLAVETEAIYGGNVYLEKQDYIIEAQRAKIAELERRNAELTADNERQSRLLTKTTIELDEKQDQLADADTVLEAVADAAYDEAVKVVANIAVNETQKADQEVIDKMIGMTSEPERRMKQKDRELVTSWLEGVKSNIVKRAAKVFSAVVTALQKPEYRRAAKAKIKETAKPAVSEMLRTYTERYSQKQHSHSRRSGMER